MIPKAPPFAWSSGSFQIACDPISDVSCSCPGRSNNDGGCRFTANARSGSRETGLWRSAAGSADRSRASYDRHCQAVPGALRLGISDANGRFPSANKSRSRRPLVRRTNTRNGDIVLRAESEFIPSDAPYSNRRRQPGQPTPDPNGQASGGIPIIATRSRRTRRPSGG